MTAPRPTLFEYAKRAADPPEEAAKEMPKKKSRTYETENRKFNKEWELK